MIGKSLALNFYAIENKCTYYFSFTGEMTANTASLYIGNHSNFIEWTFKLRKYANSTWIKRLSNDRC